MKIVGNKKCILKFFLSVFYDFFLFATKEKKLYLKFHFNLYISLFMFTYIIFELIYFQTIEENFWILNEHIRSKFNCLRYYMCLSNVVKTCCDFTFFVVFL